MNDLITCLTITRPTPVRLAGLRQTLRDFAAQSYRPCEMLIVVDAASAAEAAPVLQAVEECGQKNVRVIVAGRPMSLGALRNLSWSHARGSFICTWDDDDRHHPNRLAAQYGALIGSGRPVCYLQEFLHYFQREGRIYRINFRPAPDPVAVNTIMCRTHLPMRYPEAGPQSHLGEDTALFQIIRDQTGFHALAGQPHLFVYVNHGVNISGDAHHRHLVDQMGASQGLLRRHEASLRQGLAAFDFGSDTVIVSGRNGDAFPLEANSKPLNSDGLAVEWRKAVNCVVPTGRSCLSEPH